MTATEAHPRPTRPTPTINAARRRRRLQRVLLLCVSSLVALGLAEAAHAPTCLSEAVRGGRQVYPQSANSHPGASGYALMSAVVSDELARRGW